MNEATPEFGNHSPLFAGYEPRAGVFDEMFASAGKLRPHWAEMSASLEALGAQELERRWEQAERRSPGMV